MSLEDLVMLEKLFKMLRTLQKDIRATLKGLLMVKSEII
jgi:hypothetical protein